MGLRRLILKSTTDSEQLVAGALGTASTLSSMFSGQGCSSCALHFAIGGVLQWVVRRLCQAGWTGLLFEFEVLAFRIVTENHVVRIHGFWS